MKFWDEVKKEIQKKQSFQQPPPTPRFQHIPKKSLQSLRDLSFHRCPSYQKATIPPTAFAVSGPNRGHGGFWRVQTNFSQRQVSSQPPKQGCSLETTLEKLLKFDSHSRIYLFFWKQIIDSIPFLNARILKSVKFQSEISWKEVEFVDKLMHQVFHPFLHPLLSISFYILFPRPFQKKRSTTYCFIYCCLTCILQFHLRCHWQKLISKSNPWNSLLDMKSINIKYN